MDSRLARLLEPAYRTVPAAQANQAICEEREGAAASGAALSRPPPDGGLPLGRSYEMVIDPDGTWERFASGTLPRLVYHLESVGAHPPLCKGMVVAAFVGNELRFLRAGEMIARAADLTGVSVDELFRRHGTGESRTAMRGPPLALPPNDEE